MKAEKIPWNQFGKIKTTADLLKYLEGREYEHTSYFHYTSMKALEGILSHKYFRLSCIMGSNDKLETKFITRPETCFSLCFSTGIHENLPLWYLYSGLDGRGVRLQFKKGGIKKLIGSACYELTEVNDKNEPIGIPLSLVPGKNLQMQFGDVIYFGENNGNYLDLKYNTMTNYNILRENLSKLKKEKSGFLKSLIWFYEKETRFFFQLTNEAADMILPDKRYAILMRFDETLQKSMEITFAPEVVDPLKETEQFPAIRDFIYETSAAHDSIYKGQIEMKLHNRVNK